MKGISTVIASLLLVTITISLAAVGYNFFRNVVDVKTSGNIEIHDVLPNKIIVSNNGDKPLSSQDLKVLVNGQQYPATVEGGQIEPFKSGVINVDLTSLPEGDYRMTVIGKGTSTSVVFYHYPDYTVTTPTTTTRTTTTPTTTTRTTTTPTTTTRTTTTPTTTTRTTTTPSFPTPIGFTTRTTTTTTRTTTSTPTGPTTRTTIAIVTPTTTSDIECNSMCLSRGYDF
ncbi:MAG: hypothetical protein QXF12_07380, partial [Candidatus Aenigmatarchaeota archaeon]